MWPGKGWDPRPEPASHPWLPPPREAGDLGQGLRSFHSPLILLSILSGQSQGAADWVLAPEHLLAESHFPVLGLIVFYFFNFIGI